MRTLVFVLVVAVAAAAASSCGVPPIEDLLPKSGINCKASIDLPANTDLLREREAVEAKVRIFDCKAAK